MLDKKKILIAVGLLIIVVALGFGGYYLLSNKEEAQEPAGTGKPIDQGGLLPGGGETGGEISEPVTAIEPVTEEDQAKIEAENTAKFFVAMLGSYSTDARFQNIIDLQPLMTAKMRAWADNFIKNNLPSIEKNKESVTTQVFGSSIKSFSASAATIELWTRRNKVTATENKVDNQTATVDLIKSGEKWLVDRVVWE